MNRPSSPKGEDKQRGGWPGVATENQGQLPQHPAPKALTRSMLAFQAEGPGRSKLCSSDAGKFGFEFFLPPFSNGAVYLSQ